MREATTAQAASVTAEEYLVLDRRSELRHEYVDGQILAMTGGSRNHALIVTNLGAELRQQLKGRRCEVYTSDLRVQIAATGVYAYPDVVVVCGEPRFADAHLDTLLNPTLIAEVLSPTTEAYDRGPKFEHYRRLDSLREYLLVSQHRPRIEQFQRQDANVWLFTEFTGLDQTLTLPSLDCRLALAEIYDKVVFV